MTSSGAVNRKNEKYWLTVLELFLLAVALHAVLAFMFKTVGKESVSSDRNRRFTVVCSQNDLKNDAYGLGYWLEYDDPKSFTSSDDRRGYSVIRTLFERDGFGDDVVSSDDELVALQKKKRFPADVSKRELSAYDLEIEIPAVTGFTLKPEPLPAKNNGGTSYPIWTDSSGRSLGNLSKGDVFVERVIAKKNFQTPTVLSVSYSSADMPPEVRVAESCGNSDLDIAAVRNLSSFLAKDSLTQGMMASGAKAVMYSVVWSPVRSVK